MKQAIQKLSDAQNNFGADSNITAMCQTALLNGAYKINVVICSNSQATSQDYEQAFKVLEDIEEVKIVLCDSYDLEVLQLMKESVLAASEQKKERISVAACPKEDVEQAAQELNCERVVIVCQNAFDEQGNDLGIGLTACAIAGKIANNGNPSNSFNASKLYGIYKIGANYSEDEIESLLSQGITVLETTGGNIEIIRLVTTRTKTDNQNDRTFHELNTVLVIDDVIPSIRNRLAPLIGTVKNNSKSLNAIATQVTVELENKKKAELIDSYSQPNVYLSEQDRSVCIVDVEFTVSRGINRIIVSAIINI
ncbi:MAG: phage tail sheath subtilisin-like domain-containing protein [Clostridia bacterium]|nr:phage tail sheath subtilisin-like domain-containing protein [Clostridia bacterium]